MTDAELILEKLRIEKAWWALVAMVIFAFCVGVLMGKFIL